MNKLFTLIISITFFLQALAQQASVYPVLGGDVYINLHFIKVEENHTTYELEKLINRVVPKVNRFFAAQDIHFVLKPTTEYLNSKTTLLEDWQEGRLPVFDDRLTVYIYKEVPVEGQHAYSFQRVHPETGLIPVYHEAEFAHFLIKNLLFMLGMPLQTYDDPGLIAWNEPTPGEIRKKAGKRLQTLFSKREKGKKKRSGGKEIAGTWSSESKASLSFKEGETIRYNVERMPHLRNKRLSFSKISYKEDQWNSDLIILEP